MKSIFAYCKLLQSEYNKNLEIAYLTNNYIYMNNKLNVGNNKSR